MFSVKQQLHNLLLKEKTESEILYISTIVSDIMLIIIEFIITTNIVIVLLLALLQIILDISMLSEKLIQSLSDIDTEKIECIIRIIESTLLLYIAETSSLSIILLLVISINLAFVTEKK